MLKCRGVGEERDNWDPQGGKDSLVTSLQVGQGFLYKILDSKNMGLYLLDKLFYKVTLIKFIPTKQQKKWLIKGLSPFTLRFSLFWAFRIK